jgi:hypothetical protein
MAESRGAGVSPLTLNTTLAEVLVEDEETILQVHEALEVPARADERLPLVIEMRCFCGYTEAEVAETPGVTERTGQRDWEKARLILNSALG